MVGKYCTGGPQSLSFVARRIIIETMTEADLVELRRIRRLGELGVNMSGIEIILRMRRRVEALRSEIEALQRKSRTDLETDEI